MAIPPDPGARKGRGATYNPDNRFFRSRSEAEDDGWTIAPVAVSGGAAHIAVEGVADLRVRTWHAPRISASGGTAG